MKYAPDLSVLEEIRQRRAEGGLSLDLARHDVSYLNELGTPAQKATIRTTGDAGQDRLLEATLGMRNLGKSLINLP